MSAKFFLDTNILIYTLDDDNPGKRDRARALVGEALSESRGCISTQVVQEFLNASLRKFAKPLTPADAQRFLTVVLEPLCTVFAGIDLFQQAITITDRWKFAFYDALIVASAFQAGCPILYSEDLQHGQKVESLQILNPFLL